jgi:hypothetical protein
MPDCWENICSTVLRFASVNSIEIRLFLPGEVSLVYVSAADKNGADIKIANIIAVNNLIVFI